MRSSIISILFHLISIPFHSFIIFLFIGYLRELIDGTSSLLESHIDQSESYNEIRTNSDSAHDDLLNAIQKEIIRLNFKNTKEERKEKDIDKNLLVNKGNSDQIEISSKVDSFYVQQILEPLLAAIKELNLDFSAVKRNTNSADLTDDEEGSKEGEKKKKRKGRRKDKNKRIRAEKNGETNEEEENTLTDGGGNEGGKVRERYRDGGASDGVGEEMIVTAGTSVYDSDEGEGQNDNDSGDDEDEEGDEGREGEEEEGEGEEEEEDVDLLVVKLHQEEEKDREVRN